MSKEKFISLILETLYMRAIMFREFRNEGNKLK